MPLQPIPLSELQKVGVGVQRPEGVAVGRDGRVWAADRAGAVAEILPDGSYRQIGHCGGLPDGLNFDADGHIIIGNVGGWEGDPGPVQRLNIDTGEVTDICTEVDGKPLLTSNYPIVDRHNNIWCTHSSYGTEGNDRFDGRADGFVFRITPTGQVDKMADGFQFANGLGLDPDESHLYVCQTSGCDIVRLPINADGSLGPRERYGPKLGDSIPPDFDLVNRPPPDVTTKIGAPDGVGFDIEGNLWVTLPIANKVVAITPNGDLETIIDDPSGEIMVAPTNVTWGGDDMRDLYIGSVIVPWVIKARSPIPGEPATHQR